MPEERNYSRSVDDASDSQKHNTRQLRVLKASAIHEQQVVGRREPADPAYSVIVPSAERIQQRKEQALARARDEMANTNLNVSPQVQQLFSAVARL